jgi:hypothetical protein
MPDGANAALDLFAMVFSSIVEISFTRFMKLGFLSDSCHLRASLVPMKLTDRKPFRSAVLRLGCNDAIGGVSVFAHCVGEHRAKYRGIPLQFHSNSRVSFRRPDCHK